MSAGQRALLRPCPRVGCIPSIVPGPLCGGYGGESTSAPTAQSLTRVRRVRPAARTGPRDAAIRTALGPSRAVSAHGWRRNATTGSDNPDGARRFAQRMSPRASARGRGAARPCTAQGRRLAASPGPRPGCSQTAGAHAESPGHPGSSDTQVVDLRELPGCFRRCRCGGPRLTYTRPKAQGAGSLDMPALPMLE